MVSIFVNGLKGTSQSEVVTLEECCQLASVISMKYALPLNSFYITTLGGISCDENIEFQDGDSVSVKFKVYGGIDFQHREGSKVSYLNSIIILLHLFTY